MDPLNPDNLAFAESLYLEYLADPNSVDPTWKQAFADLEPATARSTPKVGPSFLPRSIFDPNGSKDSASETTAPPAPTVWRPTNGKKSNGKGRTTHEATAVSATTLVNDRVRFLKNLGLFAKLPLPELYALGEVAEEIEVPENTTLFVQDEIGGDMVIVLEGKISIKRNGTELREVMVGQALGEMAMLNDMARVADAETKTKVRMLRITAERFWAVMEARPKLAKAMVRSFAQRAKQTGARQDKVDQLVRAYRVRGHLLADLSPLGNTPTSHPELDPAFHGFTAQDLDEVFSSETIPGSEMMKLRDMIAHLQTTYCRTIGVQFMHIDDINVKMWLQDRMERTQNHTTLSREEQIRILRKLTRAEVFEQFIHRKFVGAKRFSLEGAESLIPLLDLAVEDAGARGVREIVVGMAHRGRLNVLANIMGKNAHQIFHEFDDTNPDKYMGSGDVKYHLGWSSDVQTSSGNPVHMSLTFNPSHLEFVGPVVLGRVRAKQDRHEAQGRYDGFGIIIHGDAAFAGEGVVQEILNMSGLAGYETGGTVHIIVNNQIGFTTDPEDSRSTLYATDVAKMLQIPIFHVNGEDPEGVAQTIRVAMDFRQEFKKDVVIDMYCYRRYGHNEGDEPAFTQPLMYKRIRERKSVREGYLERLYRLGSVTEEDAERIAVAVREEFEAELTRARSPEYETIDIQTGRGVWLGYRGGLDHEAPEVETRVDRSTLQRLLLLQSEVPSGFALHAKVERILETRKDMAEGKRPLDWATAEALAFASILDAGHPIRFTGQDVIRGTFSHRHAGLFDANNGKMYMPLQEIARGKARLEIYNSPLTETGVVGFEYGYSLDTPEALVLWEAQFGDFFNVAQVIADQFIASGEDKWKRLSGLVCLLPHGFEGQGPEHSSARLERLMNACAEDNLQVANVTTPAQYFHLLRRQVLRSLRKPLFVMSPKSLLRHPLAVSSMDELVDGAFERIIPDRSVTDPGSIRKVLLTSGKIYYDLLEEKGRREAEHVAIVRMEQYYPQRPELLDQALAGFAKGTPVAWVQEEPRNMGAWSYLYTHFGPELLGRHPFSGVTRAESASPATGSGASHKKEQGLLLEEAFQERS